MQQSAKNPVEILLIESIQQNVDLVEKMLNSTKSQYRLHVENSVTGAFNFLRKEGDNKNKPKPDVVFLNSDPAFDFGKEINKEINNNNSYLGIPVLFLNIADNKIQVIKTIDKHINFHSTEKLDIGYFVETIVSLKMFMVSLVKISDMEMSC